MDRIPDYFTIKVPVFIQASHQLPDSDFLISKECTRLHGHTYFIKITASGENKRNGMVVDFKAIKNLVNDLFDHRHLNDVFEELKYDFPTTAENTALVVYQEIRKQYRDIEYLKVEVCEGYKGEENSSWASYDRN